MPRFSVPFKMFALACFVAAFFVLIPLRAADSPVAGSWDCVATTPSGDEVKLTLVIKEEDGKLTGIAKGDNGDLPLKDVKLDGDQFSFSLTIDDNTYETTATLSGAKFEGTWKGGGDSGPVKGAKQS